MDKYSIINFTLLAFIPLLLGTVAITLLIFIEPVVMAYMFLSGLFLITYDRFEEVKKHNQFRYSNTF